MMIANKPMFLLMNLNQLRFSCRLFSSSTTNQLQLPNAANAANASPPFKYGELVIACIIRKPRKSRKPPTCNYKLFELKKNGQFNYKYFQLMHEHIIHKSTVVSDQPTFKVLNDDASIIRIKRPTLYEYIALKEQKAVSSHFSILSLVPLLLEIGDRSRLFECGTGSGSMTMFLSKHLGHSGRLDTYDITQAKEINARNSFTKWKNSYDLSSSNADFDKWPDNVHFGTMNLTEHKFDEKYNEYYDAVYLDMADLSKAMENAHKILKPNGILLINSMHLTQILKCLNRIRDSKLSFVNELILEPSNRIWEINNVLGPRQHNQRPVITKTSSSDEEHFLDQIEGDQDKDDNEEDQNNDDDSLNWTCRLEDRFVEKFKRGGLFFNYWQGYLAKFRKIT